MKRINCLIVDDEELARTLLENFVNRLPQLNLLGQCRNPIEALPYMQDQAPDILFLDIQMPELTGVEFLKTLAHPPIVIFTTAYPGYALDGYSLNVTDYLLKPFSFERFVQAVNKAESLLRLQRSASLATKPNADKVREDFLLVKSEHKVHRLRLSTLLYIQSMREYVAYYTTKGRILSLNSLKALEQSLPADRFLRIHKSYIVSIDHIQTLEGNQLHINGEKLPIGASYKETVLAKIF
ncbi:MAG: response regulator transcription factor [Bacteroidota bacterium]